MVKPNDGQPEGQTDQRRAYKRMDIQNYGLTKGLTDQRTDGLKDGLSKGLNPQSNLKT